MVETLRRAAWIAAAVWVGLVVARGRFWDASADGLRPAADAFGPADADRAAPDVHAVVPARNEEDVIARTMGSLLAQDYPGRFAITVVDDRSDDGTGDIARATMAQRAAADRAHVVDGRPRPDGWTGKVWALAEGVAAARATGPAPAYWWFTDADVEHDPDTLARLVATAVRDDRALVSQMVALHCASPWERLLIPAFVFFFAKLYPFAWVNNPRNRTAAAAGGCMLVRRSALEEAGGIESIRAELIDDCSLAARIKHRGTGRHPIRLDVAARSVSLRPYDSWREIWNMIARTAFTQLHYSPLLLAGTLAGMTIIYLMPPVAALVLGPQGWPAWIAWAAMCCAYAPMLSYYRRSPLWAPFLPLVALFYVGATFASAVRYWRGKGGQWKSRVQAPVQER
jgi:hopene-associated glycosyltransferase HpnB